MYARLRCGGNLLQCLAFGTGEGHLWYGICVPCSKRLPGVRDTSSEAFGVKNRLLWYRMGFQRHSVRRTASYGTVGFEK